MTTIDIVFSMDNTGSMSPAISELRRRMAETTKRLYRDIPDLRMGLIIHEDYCDRNFVRVSPLTTNEVILEQDLSTIRAGGGGDAAECYEYALYEAQKFAWRKDAVKILVVIGDENPHDARYITDRYPSLLPKDRKSIDWRTETQNLVNLGVSVYGVQALGYGHSRAFYEELAKRGNGYKLNLDQLSNIVETVIAICYKQTGGEQLQNYQNELQASGKLNRSLASLMSVLSGKEMVKFESTGLELHAVPPSRFQVLNVDERIAIQKFVEKNGARFKKGNGFYEFSKAEDIQERKEVVLVDKRNGDMYSGSKARDLIGLPYGERGRISLADLKELRRKYDVFVQSTSNNRVLMPSTKFLYENEA